MTRRSRQLLKDFSKSKTKIMQQSICIQIVTGLEVLKWYHLNVATFASVWLGHLSFAHLAQHVVRSWRGHSRDIWNGWPCRRLAEGQSTCQLKSPSISRIKCERGRFNIVSLYYTSSCFDPDRKFFLDTLPVIRTQLCIADVIIQSLRYFFVPDVYLWLCVQGLEVCSVFVMFKQHLAAWHSPLGSRTNNHNSISDNGEEQ